MPNYAQAAIQLRQNKERRAKERGSKRQAPGENNNTDQNNASAIKIQVMFKLQIFQTVSTGAHNKQI